MTVETAYSPLWRTASFSDTPDRLLLDALELQQHVVRCRQVYGRMHRLRYQARGVLRFCHAHIITAVFLTLLLLGVVSLAL